MKAAKLEVASIFKIVTFAGALDSGAFALNDASMLAPASALAATTISD